MVKINSRLCTSLLSVFLILLLFSLSVPAVLAQETGLNRAVEFIVDSVVGVGDALVNVAEENPASFFRVVLFLLVFAIAYMGTRRLPPNMQGSSVTFVAVLIALTTAILTPRSVLETFFEMMSGLAMGVLFFGMIVGVILLVWVITPATRVGYGLRVLFFIILLWLTFEFGDDIGNPSTLGKKAAFLALLIPTSLYNNKLNIRLNKMLANLRGRK